MNKSCILKVILIISIAGILFSGYLSYTELFTPKTALSCSAQSIGGFPVCIYGLIMYLIIFILALLGLNSKK